MKNFIFIISCIFLLGCKSANKKTYLKECERTILRTPINIKSYEELIVYGDNLNRKLDLIIMDGIIADEFLLNKFIFNNPNYYLVDFKSYLDTGTDGFDSPPVRILFLKSNLCGKLKKKKGEYVIENKQQICHSCESRNPRHNEE